MGNPQSYPELYADLIVILLVCFTLVVAAVIACAVITVRIIVRSNEALAARYEQLRTEALQEYVRVQRAENAKLVKDTRAATAKMNVMADALWEGLQGTVRDP